MKARLALTLVSLLLGASLVGCGGSNKPAVCGSVDTLKTSITDLKNVKLTSSGALSSLQTQLTTIKTDFDAVKGDAKSQFTTQINAVDSSYTTLKTSADAATAAPSAATLATAAAALAAFATSVQTLVSDVQATC